MVRKQVIAVIRELTTDTEIHDSVPVIRDAFKTVADELSLTPANCPTHPSFITHDALVKLKQSGCRFFGLFTGGLQAGFVAIERSDGDVYYIEKLSVIPHYRHNGYGAMLMAFASVFVRGQGGTSLSVGIIDEHAVLKEWYGSLGFSEVAKRHYDHLPFTVCFMEKALV